MSSRIWVFYIRIYASVVQTVNFLVNSILKITLFRVLLPKNKTSVSVK